VKQVFNGNVIASCGSEEKLLSSKNMGADYVVNYKDGGYNESSFKEKIMELTNNKGLDVILDCIGPSQWGLYKDVLGTDSRLVSYGY